MSTKTSVKFVVFEFRIGIVKSGLLAYSLEDGLQGAKSQTYSETNKMAEEQTPSQSEHRSDFVPALAAKATALAIVTGSQIVFGPILGPVLLLGAMTAAFCASDEANKD